MLTRGSSFGAIFWDFARAARDATTPHGAHPAAARLQLMLHPLHPRHGARRACFRAEEEEEVGELKGLKLRRDQVIVRGDMWQIAEPVCRGDRELRCIIQARIPEPARSVQFEVRDERVPVRHGSPAGPGVQIDAAEAKSRRDQCGARHIRSRNLTVCDLLRIEGLAVEEQFGIEFSRTPAGDHRPHRVLADGQEARNRTEIGGERDDSSDIQIAIGSAVEPVSDTTRAGVRIDCAGTECGTRVVDGRVTDRALQPDRLESSGRIEAAGNPDDGVQLQQIERDGRIFEIDLGVRQLRQQAFWQCIDIDF